MARDVQRPDTVDVTETRPTPPAGPDDLPFEDPDRPRARPGRPTDSSGAVPSVMFSATVRLSAKVKCWWTMPTPAASAARVSPGGSGRPKTSTVPASAT